MLSVRLSKAVRSLPISVRTLGREAGLPGQVSVRELLRRTSTHTRPLNVKVLRYTWAVNAPDANVHPLWPDAALREVLDVPNGWSMLDFWSASTLRLRELRFSVEPWRPLVGISQVGNRDDRGGMVNQCRAQAERDGVSFDGVDRIVVFMHPPPCNSGAIGGAAVLDQGGFVSFYDHEIGHVIGFDHAFGPCGDYVYQDDYSVMGFTGVQDRAVPLPAAFVGVTVISPGFFRSDRNLSPAALYRYVPEFAGSSSVLRPDLATKPRIRLAAFGQANLHDPVLAVVPTSQGEITVEYRARFGQDAAIRPAVVVHSIGRRPTLAWQGEENPVWLEGTAAVGASLPTEYSVDTVLKVQVVAVSPDLRYVEVVLSDP
ncbi:hypothetical protein ACIBEJ_13120 [Nonomuraea sp. NPDC050790]|uniref:hypothetical protein n=1 Tax=Nonomuraea sp. NPDC050790 TaxID=3364371 RepID=UPI0037BC03F3